MEASRLNGMPLLNILAGPNWREEKLGEEVAELLKKMQAGRTFSDFLDLHILGVTATATRKESKADESRE